jgi:hypothetical protein
MATLALLVLFASALVFTSAKVNRKSCTDKETEAHQHAGGLHDRGTISHAQKHYFCEQTQVSVQRKMNSLRLFAAVGSHFKVCFTLSRRGGAAAELVLGGSHWFTRLTLLSLFRSVHSLHLRCW